MAKLEELIQDIPIFEVQLADGCFWQWDPLQNKLRFWSEDRAAWLRPQQIAIVETLRRVMRSHARPVPRMESDGSPVERGPVPHGQG